MPASKTTPGRKFFQAESEWNGIERRREANVLFDMIAQQNEKLDKMTEFVRSSTTDQAQRLESLASGFPSGDPAGHRRYHEAEIKRIEARAEFWSKLRLSVTQWGLLGFLGWALVSLWHEFLKGPK